MAKAQEEILLLLEIHREHADDIALEGGQPMVMFMIGAKGKTAEGKTIKAGGGASTACARSRART